MKRLTPPVLLLSALAGCSATPTVIPTKNLDRPTDMSFVCLGMVANPGDATTVLSGQPMRACHPRGAVDPAANQNGQRTLGTFAFISNAGLGELAVADMDTGRLLDLDPESPGYGMLPVGSDPESLSTSQDGCWVVAANRASCDFSLVDPSRLLTGPFSSSGAQATPATGTGDAVRRLRVQTGSGKTLYASTGEVAFLPPSSSSPVCLADDRPRAVATFPGCDMVATLELSFADSTATITSAYYVRPDLPGGVQPAGTEPSCPVECQGPSSGGAVDAGAGAAGGAAQVDAGQAGTAVDAGGQTIDGGATAVDGGVAGITPVDAGAGPAQNAWYLQPLALVPDGSRVYVASLYDSAITSFAIGDAGLSNPTRLELAENPIGVNRLRLGVDPYGTTQVTRADGSTATVQGQFLSKRGSFLYALARDDSVRVVDIDGPSPVECDVNIMATPDQKGRACFPVGSGPRRPLAHGPGIEIPSLLSPDSAAPLPRDLAFADLESLQGDNNVQALNGQFGFLLGSNGQVYVINLAPTGEDTVTATNSFREYRDLGQTTYTPIALTIAPQRTAVVSDQAFATTESFSTVDGPLIKSFPSADGTTTNWLDYPDPNSFVSRVWDVVWEGTLPDTARASGIVHPASGQLAGTLSDTGADYCRSGVQAGDVLMFSGCTQDSDCQPDDQFSCQVAVSGARGMCLPIDNAARTALLSNGACSQFMGSRMRYRIVSATPTSLALGLKLDEVPKTTLNPCQQDSDCQPDAQHGQGSGAGAGGEASAHVFSCVEVYPNDRRCVEKCTQDVDCRQGNVCEPVPGVLGGVGDLCVEAPPLDQDHIACLPQPMTSYSVHAGEAYMVYGSSLPTPRTTTLSPSGTCALDTNANPSLVNRIPLSAPQCPDSFFAQAPQSGSSTAFVRTGAVDVHHAY